MYDDPFDFREIEESYKKREAEFEKLSTDPPCGEIKEGTRVLVAAGPIGMGFDWIRLEATVIEVADTAYCVQFKDQIDYNTRQPKEMWVHRNIITDILKDRS